MSILNRSEPKPYQEIARGKPYQSDFIPAHLGDILKIQRINPKSDYTQITALDLPDCLLGGVPEKNAADTRFKIAFINLEWIRTNIETLPDSYLLFLKKRALVPVDFEYVNAMLEHDESKLEQRTQLSMEQLRAIKKSDNSILRASIEEILKHGRN